MMGENKEIMVRSFRGGDEEAVARILVGAFRNKFQMLTKLSEEALVELMVTAGMVGALPFEGNAVAVCGEEVVGVIQLKWRGQERPSQPMKKGFWWICRRFGFLNMARLIGGLAILEEAVREGDCYVEHLAVSEAARGLGVGTKLLGYGKDMAAGLEGVKRLSLYVAGSNEGAIRLYEKVGFQERERTVSRLTGMLLGEKEWRYMAMEGMG